MIKRLAIVIALLMILQSRAMAVSRVMVVQSMSIRPYEEVVRGFSSVCPEKPIRVTLSDIPNGSYPLAVKEFSPKLVLTVGLGALDAAISIGHPPVVFTMVLPQDIANSGVGENITGVFMQVPAEMQLEHIVMVLPKVKRIGLLFDPKQSSKMAEEALIISRRMGIELLTEAVKNPRDVSAGLRNIKGRVEVVWMLPDITVSIPRSMELFALFSFENRIPLVTYTETHIEKGAFMSIEVSPFDMGRQAGDLSNVILAGGDLPPLPLIEARTAVVTLNKIIADKFAIKIDETTLDVVNVFDRD